VAPIRALIRLQASCLPPQACTGELGGGAFGGRNPLVSRFSGAAAGGCRVQRTTTTPLGPGPTVPRSGTTSVTPPSARRSTPIGKPSSTTSPRALCNPSCPMKGGRRRSRRTSRRTLRLPASRTQPRLPPGGTTAFGNTDIYGGSYTDPTPGQRFAQLTRALGSVTERGPAPSPGRKPET
jgi:hypothetical protein